MPGIYRRVERSLSALEKDRANSTAQRKHRSGMSLTAAEDDRLSFCTIRAQSPRIFSMMRFRGKGNRDLRRLRLPQVTLQAVKHSINIVHN